MKKARARGALGEGKGTGCCKEEKSLRRGLLCIELRIHLIDEPIDSPYYNNKCAGCGVPVRRGKRRTGQADLFKH
jgi:hypothetical protein